jgi:hypothetical protein
VEHTPPRSKESPAPPTCGVGIVALRGSKMLLYVETWLPLLSVAVTAATLCGLVSFMMGRAER